MDLWKADVYSRAEIIIAISPARWDVLQLWTDDINKHLKLVKEFRVEGQVYYRIFEVDYAGFEDE